MKRASKSVMVGVAVAILAVIVVALLHGLRIAAIGTAYTAKTLCSAIFVSQRDPQSVLHTDLSADDLAPLRHINTQVDRDAREVTAAFLGLARRKAVYREGRGCTIVNGEVAKPSPPRTEGSADRLRPHRAVTDALETADRLPPSVNQRRLDSALEWAFSEPNPAFLRRTRAVVVLYKDRLVAERYAEGFTKDTPLIGWSMTKSVINALVGVLVKEGKASLGDPVALPQWRGSSDPRRNITLDHLLRMTSGLQFREAYANPLADVTYMLLGVPDTAAYAAAKPLEAEPGTRWSYSSGTTNIIAYAIRRIVASRATWNSRGMPSSTE